MKLERRDLLRYGSVSALVTASGCLGLIGGGDDSADGDTGEGGESSGGGEGPSEDGPEETETGTPAEVLSQRVTELTRFLDFASGPARGARSGYVKNIEQASEALSQLEQADPSSVTEDDLEAVGEHLSSAAAAREPLNKYYTEHYPVEKTGEEFVSEATAAVQREDYNSFEDILFDYKSIVAALRQSATIGPDEYYPLSVVHRSQYELLLNSAVGNVELEGSTDLSYDRIGEIYHRGSKGQFAGYLTPVDLPLVAEPFNKDQYDSFENEQSYEYSGDIESKLTIDAAEDEEDTELENPIYPFVYRDVFAIDEARVSDTFIQIIHCNFVDWGGTNYPDGFLREVEREDDDRPTDVRPDRSTPMNVDKVGRQQQSLAYIQQYESAEAATAAFESIQESVGVGEEGHTRNGFTWTRLYVTESAAEETLYADAAQVGTSVILTELTPRSWRDREAADETSDGDENDPDNDNKNEYPSAKILEGTLFDLTDLTDSDSDASENSD